MNQVAPRYEYRVFSQNLGVAEERMRRLSGVSSYRESLEIYIMSASNDENNTKIRDDLLDIKTLVNRDRQLEQWKPRMKGAFPMPKETILADMFPAFGADIPRLERDNYSLDQFLNEIIQPHPELAAVSVFKRRYAFDIPGCIAEIADVLVNGAALRTACLESEEPERVLKTAETIGMAGQENVNYLIAIKRVIGMTPLPEGVYYRAV